MTRTLFAGVFVGAMIFAAGGAYAQTPTESWAPAGVAAADPGTAPVQISLASGTDSWLSIPVHKVDDTGAGSSADSQAWVPAGGAAADVNPMHPQIVATMGTDS